MEVDIYSYDVLILILRFLKNKVYFFSCIVLGLCIGSSAFLLNEDYKISQNINYTHNLIKEVKSCPKDNILKILNSNIKNELIKKSPNVYNYIIGKPSGPITYNSTFFNDLCLYGHLDKYKGISFPIDIYYQYNGYFYPIIDYLHYRNLFLNSDPVLREIGRLNLIKLSSDFIKGIKNHSRGDRKSIIDFINPLKNYSKEKINLLLINLMTLNVLANNI